MCAVCYHQAVFGILDDVCIGDAQLIAEGTELRLGLFAEMVPRKTAILALRKAERVCGIVCGKQLAVFEGYKSAVAAVVYFNLFLFPGKHNLSFT